jgi:membrane protein
MKKNLLNRIYHFFAEDLWNIPENPTKPIQSFLIKTLKFILSACIGFYKDECTLKASALTYYSLLTIVPFLAVVFVIATGLGLEKSLESLIVEKFQDQPDIANKIKDFTQTTLAHTQGGVIAGTGILMLIWAVLMLTSCIAQSVNNIWKIKKTPSFSKILTSYLVIMFFCPIFFVTSSSISIYALRGVVEASKATDLYSTLNPLINFLFHFVPIILSWLSFTFVYLFVPSTKVSWKSGVIAGLLAGTTYQIFQWIYFHFQIGLSSYGIIYGGFAAIPLFLIWLNLSWLILLAGAVIAYQLEKNHVASKKLKI